MARILLKSDDAGLVKKAKSNYHINDIFLAMDSTVSNKHRARALGLGRYALVGANADEDTYDEVLTATPKKKSKPKQAKIEAVDDGSKSEEVQ